MLTHKSQEDIKSLQQEDPQYSEMIKNMKTRNKTFSGEFSLNPQGVLYKNIKPWKRIYDTHNTQTTSNIYAV